MTVSLLQARKLQNLAGRYMYGEEAPFTDITRWKEMQHRLAGDITDLIKVQGSSPEEEAEVLLAVLMGYCVTIRNDRHVDEALVRAEKVLPNLQDKVLKCHLMVFCYGECPDELLADDIYRLMDELKDEGKEEEIRVVMELMENLVESQL